MKLSDSRKESGTLLDKITLSAALELWRDAEAFCMAELRKQDQLTPDTAQHLFATIQFVLATYNHPDNWPNPEGPPKEYIPNTFAASIATQSGYLATGFLPDPMRDAIASHRRKAGPDESRDIGRAVAYIAAVRERLIVDRSPIKTVALAYDVDRSTVHKWRRKLDWVTPKDFYPDANKAEHGNLLKEGMLAAAARYCIAGRSAGAVTRRNRKRSNS